MERTASLNHEQPGYLGLAGLVLILIVGGAVLYAIAGLPHLPTHLPSWQLIISTLRGSYLPPDVVAYVFLTAAWIVWFWIVFSLLLGLLVAGADAIAHGAAWVRAFRAASDRVTLPIVRRAIDSALVAAFVVNMVSRTVPDVAAAGPPRPVPPPHPAAVRPQAQKRAVAEARHASETPESLEYRVQSGDTLWGIAERFYGNGDEFPRLVTANVGRQMPDGERFARTGVIQPGWVLEIPLPAQWVERVNGHTVYVVQDGDTLQSIAARTLGNEEQWKALFELNRNRATIAGHVLTDPNLIWPGLRLQVPIPSTHIAAPDRPPVGDDLHHPKKKPIAVATAITSRPTSIPVSPTPRATARTRTPIPAPTSAATSPHTVLPDDGDWVPYSAAVGAAVATAGVGVLLARRRVRRSLDEPPIPAPKAGPCPGDDFLEAEPDRTLRHRIYGGDLELVAVVAEQVCRFFAGQGLQEVSVIWGEQGRNVVTLLLSVPRDDRARVIELAGECGARLGGKGRAVITPDHDVALQISRLKAAEAITPPGRYTDTDCLLPSGVLQGGELLSVNWDALGHVLIAGLPHGGTDIVLTSIIAALAARRPPDWLRLWTIAGPGNLPEQLRQLPHQCSDFIDPGDPVRVHQVLEHLRTELIRRMRGAQPADKPRWSPSEDEPELVLVVSELGELKDDGTTLEMIGSQGPEYGVRLLTASARAETLGDVLVHFETRIVLEMVDDEASVAVLGRPEAADLDVGQLFLCVAGRTPMRLRGFRVSDDHLDALVRLMRRTYGGVPPGLWETAFDAPQGEGPDTDEELITPAVEGLAQDKTPIPPESMNEHVAPKSGISAPKQTVHTGWDGSSPSGDVVPQKVTVGPLESAVGQPELTSADEGGPDPVDIVDEPPAAHLPIQVQCFGGFIVRSGAREITPSGSEGKAYKAWELLAFLAVQPDGAAPTDKLLDAVWTGVDEERAANRMRTTMGRLRDVLASQVPNLPSEVVRADREGMCRLDTTLVTSDAHRFVSILRTASRLPTDQALQALEEIRSLYRGDLLSGWGARGYEWLDERSESGVTLREHYREEYARAMRRLARLYRETERAELAIPILRGLLAVDPTLEDVVRELYRCYGQLSDLPSLLREDRHLRQALRGAYGDPNDSTSDSDQCEPEPETVALFNKIRQELA